jgi:hypothetical protein
MARARPAEPSAASQASRARVASRWSAATWAWWRLSSRFDGGLAWVFFSFIFAFFFFSFRF